MDEIKEKNNNCGAILLVDFKLTENNEIRVVELGCGTNSTFSGYDCFFDDHSEHMRLKTLRSLSSDFDQINCINAGIENDSGAFGYIATNIRLLKNKNIHNVTQSTHSDILSSRSINDNEAVIHYGTDSKNVFRQGIFSAEQVKAKEIQNAPVFMNGSAPVMLMAEDKFMYSKFANESKCKLKPYDQLLHFDLLTDTEIDKIIDEFPKYPLVIKATNASGGMGALIAKDKNHAKLLLLAIKHKKYDASQLALSITEKEALNFWFERSQENDRFCLIQEYVAGKKILIKDKTYEPTGRLVFYVYYIDNKRHFKIIDGYWKLPRHNSNENLLSVENAISHITEENGLISNSFLIEKEVMNVINNQFEVEISPLLNHVFQLDPNKIILDMLQSNNPIESKYAITKLPKLTESFFNLIEHFNKEPVQKYILNTLKEKILSLDLQKVYETNNAFYQISQKYLSLDEPLKKDFLDLLYEALKSFYQPFRKLYDSTYHKLLVFLSQNDSKNFTENKLAQKLSAINEEHASQVNLMARKGFFASTPTLDYGKSLDFMKEKIRSIEVKNKSCVLTLSINKDDENIGEFAEIFYSNLLNQKLLNTSEYSGVKVWIEAQISIAIYGVDNRNVEKILNYIDKLNIKTKNCGISDTRNLPEQISGFIQNNTENCLLM